MNCVCIVSAGSDKQAEPRTSAAPHRTAHNMTAQVSSPLSIKHLSAHIYSSSSSSVSRVTNIQHMGLICGGEPVEVLTAARTESDVLRRDKNKRVGLTFMAPDPRINCNPKGELVLKTDAEAFVVNMLSTSSVIVPDGETLGPTGAATTPLQAADAAARRTGGESVRGGGGGSALWRLRCGRVCRRAAADLRLK